MGRRRTDRRLARMFQAFNRALEANLKHRHGGVVDALGRSYLPAGPEEFLGRFWRDNPTDLEAARPWTYGSGA